MRRGQKHTPKTRAQISRNRKGKGTGPRPRPPRYCVICGDPLTPEPGRQIPKRITCSDECRRESTRLTARDAQRDLGHQVWGTPEGRERILDALRRFAERQGRPPSCTEWYARERRGGRPGLAAVMRTFGSWNAALREAGLPTRAQGSGKYV